MKGSLNWLYTKTTDLNKFVNQQHMKGMSDQAIAGSLGLTLERLYFLMSREDEAGTDEKTKEKEL